MALPTVTADSRGIETETVMPSYSVPHAAILIGVGPFRLWEMIRENEIPSFTIDGRLLVNRRALDEYLAKREVAGQVDESGVGARR